MIRGIKLAMVLTAAMWIGASGLWAQTTDFGSAEPYVVKKGDTATKIAQNHYGKPGLGKMLWEANKSYVAHPKRLTVGDTIYLFPEETLRARKGAAAGLPPGAAPKSLYDRGELLKISFPKYFNFVADERGLGGSGAIRAKVKKTVVDNKNETSQDVEESFEIRRVGKIIASSEHPGFGSAYGNGANRDKARFSGKTLLTTNDTIIIQFYEDIAKILDSDTYGDSDPYFREFPIYGRSQTVRGSTLSDRVDKGKNLGSLYQYRGNMTVVARIEGIAPLEPKNAKALKRGGGNKPGQGYEPVNYVGRITSSVDAVELDDDIFLFVPLMPGPERKLEPPYVERPGSYTPLGN